MEEEFHFVRVRVTTELMDTLLKNGVKHFEVKNGIDHTYTFSHMAFEHITREYYIYYTKGKVPEGVTAISIDPTIERFDLKKNLNNVIDERVYEL